MTIKFYSYWTPIIGQEVDADSSIKRTANNGSVQELSNELNTVLGNQELVSLTSSATDGIVVTTIAYEASDTELPE